MTTMAAERAVTALSVATTFTALDVYSVGTLLSH